MRLAMDAPDLKSVLEEELEIRRADVARLEARIAALEQNASAEPSKPELADEPDERLTWQQAAGTNGFSYHTIRLWALDPRLDIGCHNGGRGFVWKRRLGAYLE